MSPNDMSYPSAPSIKALGKRRAHLDDDALSHPARRGQAGSSRTSSLYEGSWKYHHPWLKHTSCVNALSCSNGSGQWLASAGDDSVVMLWNTFGDISNELPKAKYRGPKRNILSVTFTCDNEKLLSTGADTLVYLYDVEKETLLSPERWYKSDTAIDLWAAHDDSVNSVQAHPHNPSLFMTAAYDGIIATYDTRAEIGVVATLAERAGFNDIKYHPNMPELFVTADEKGRVTLQDARVAFEDKTRVDQTALERAVRIFDTKRYRTSSTRKQTPAASSITFSRDGSVFCTTFSESTPALYETSSIEPLACFYTAHEADGHGYRNTTTTKHSSFSGGAGNDLFLAAGSDDFNAYIWKVPSVQLLKDRRQSRPARLSGSPVVVEAGSECFPSSADPTQCTEPYSVTVPTAVLSAHRSIVNTALFHPTLPLVFTCGIEKMVQVHSSTPFSPRSKDLHAIPRFVPRKPKPGNPLLLWLGESEAEDDEEEYMDAPNQPNEVGVEKECRESRKVLEHFDLLLAPSFPDSSSVDFTESDEESGNERHSSEGAR
ncbi:hypothetical protein OIV83_003082 [Microbotryomycetes sp. JL201]|nr:hypothetical protein OIV83_003082 [Microbotryomycetes sp. JL201]